MTRIAETITELIGNTPLLRLDRFAKGLNIEVLAKLEMLNPSGSDKDRVALEIIEEAEQTGELTPDTVIIESTSGNFAFSLAAVAIPRGYHLILVMPDVVPAWRVRLLRAMGAEVVLTPAARGMKGAEVRAEALAREFPSVFYPNQFSNPANPTAHAKTAEEIWQATAGELDLFVAPVGTGGTVTGIGRRLKTLSGGNVQVIAVEPAASPVLSGGRARPHGIHGMGAPFVPENFDRSVVDRIVGVGEAECQDALLRLYRSEGVLSGPAGGAALAATLQLAALPEYAGKRAVVVLPDTMERYSQTDFWATGEKLLMPTFNGG